MAQAREYVAGGRRGVVDLDLEKFFDRVNHDLLLARVAREVRVFEALDGWLRRKLRGILWRQWKRP